MAHPDRAPAVAELTAALGQEVPIHWDPEGPPSGAGDRVWRVARKAWEMADPAAAYHVLIQDDALVCPDFLAGVERALQAVPGDVVVSPYLGSGRTVPLRWGQMAQKANTIGASWIVSGRVMWGVCLILPTPRIPEMIKWCDRKSGMPDDMRVGAWAVRHDIDVWYTWPSLVDHGAEPSLTKHRHTERVARRHHQGSALDLDWSGPVVTDPMVTRRRGPRSGPRGVWRGSDVAGS